jgi:hypothetical protein
LRLALFLLAGCTVPLGAVPDAAPCAPSTSFFVSDMWLGYFGRNQCATSSCHDFDGGHGYLRFHAPGTMPDAASPIATWPPAWRDNYQQAIQLVRCDQPLSSRLLTVPEGKADPHPPGVSIDVPAAAELLFQEWVTAPGPDERCW